MTESQLYNREIQTETQRTADGSALLSALCVLSTSAFSSSQANEQQKMNCDPQHLPTYLHIVKYTHHL